MVDAQQFARVAAADWLQVLDSPEVTEAQLQCWLEWYGASAQHRQAFDEMQRLYRRLTQLPASERQRLRERFFGPPTSGQYRLRRWAWGVCVLLVGSLCLVLLTRAWREHPTLLTFAAAPGRHRTVQLSDGTQVVLAPDSMLTVRYSRDTRAVELERGQAFFQVHHDRRWPFLVRTGAVQVVAVGTAFNVSRDEGGVAVTVTDGTVDVNSLPSTSDPNEWYRLMTVNEPRRLSVGHRLMIAASGELTDGRTTSTPAPAWRNGQLAWKEGRRAEVVETVNRDSTIRIRIDDPRVADLLYSGTILQGHVDEWLAALPHIYPVQTMTLDDGSIALTLAPTASSMQ